MTACHSQLVATLCTHDQTLDILTDNSLPQSFARHDSLTVMCNTIHLTDGTFRCSACLLKLAACKDGVRKSLPALCNVCMHAQGHFTVSHHHAVLPSCIGHMSVQRTNGRWHVHVWMYSLVRD